MFRITIKVVLSTWAYAVAALRAIRVMPILFWRLLWYMTRAIALTILRRINSTRMVRTARCHVRRWIDFLDDWDPLIAKAHRQGANQVLIFREIFGAKHAIFPKWVWDPLIAKTHRQGANQVLIFREIFWYQTRNLPEMSVGPSYS